MSKFYRGEITSQINHNQLSYYIEAESELEAENKLRNYYDNNLMRTYGDIDYININQIESSEYFGMKKYFNDGFI